MFTRSCNPLARADARPGSLILFILLMICATDLLAQAPIPPETPRVYVDTRWQPPTGRTIQVNVGGNLQAAIDNAARGDEIVLTAGARFVGNFILRAKPGAGTILIRSSALFSLPAGMRVSPAARSFMATVSSPNQNPVFVTEFGASGYRIAGLEITLEPASTFSYGLVALGTATETQVSQLPSDMILDRDYIHGTSQCACKRGVALNGVRQAVIDSYISEIQSDVQDSQAIAGWNGPGPFKIVNNYLEAAGENVMFGGADPSIQYRAIVRNSSTSSAILSSTANLAVGDDVTFTVGGNTGPGYTTIRSMNGNVVSFDPLPAAPDSGGLVYWGPGPADIEIRANHFFKPLSWKPGHPSYAGRAWAVKNLFELKDGQRVLLDGNIFENCWVSAQTGIGVVLKSANDGGNCPQCTMRDIIFRNAIIRNAEGGGFLLQGRESYTAPNRMPGVSRRIHIDNVLVYPATARLITILNNTSDVLISHLTGLSSDNTLVTNYEDGVNNARFAIRDSIIERRAYGFGSGASEGKLYLDRFFQPWSVDRMMLVNTSTDSSSRLVSGYPFAMIVDGMEGVGFANAAGMLTDYHGLMLAPGSIGRSAASDGKDLGVDLARLDAALRASDSMSPSVVPVTLSSQPAALSFQIQQGDSPRSQQLTVTASSPVPLVVLTVTMNPAANCSANWLSAGPVTGISPLPITVSANPAGLAAPVTCSGSIAISAAGATPLVVPITLSVTAPPSSPIVISPSSPGTTTNGWTVSRRLVVNRSQILSASPLQNFPMLVSVTDTDLRHTSNGGRVAKVDGTDVRFTGATGTKLAHEIESYDPVSGKLTAWVNVPSLSSASDTILYLAYGNPTASDQQNRNGVWDSSFRLVHHFSSGVVTSVDSTQNANTGTVVAGITQEAGIAGSAYRFNGVNRLRIPQHASWSGTFDHYAVEYWLKAGTLYDYRGSVAVGGWGGQFNNWFYSNGYGAFRMDTTAGFCQVPAYIPVDGAFHHLAITHNSSTSRIDVYVDGRFIDSRFCSGKVTIPAGSLSVGGFEGGLSFEGSLDELRISAGSPRSPEWIATQYNNQRNPAAFSTLGAVE